MLIKPVDVVVATKLISVAISGITFEALTEVLGISPSEAHQASKRLVRSGLFKDQHRRAWVLDLLVFLGHLKMIVHHPTCPRRLA